MKPSIPKGTRDFSPVEMLRRQYIFDTIRGVFRKYGFLPLETPAMENLETLTGKYGEEGDRLIFKVLDSGEFMASAVGQLTLDQFGHMTWDEVVQLEGLSKKLAPRIASKALRYDLTVPFARYVVMHQHELAFPFKRYQIQPVWRADRPQKGRYREFCQCDADMIGSVSLLNEVDLVLVMLDVFDALGLAFKVHVNNRKVLQGLGELWSISDRIVEFVTILDKFDKIGLAVVEEYRKAGFAADLCTEVGHFLEHERTEIGLKARFEAKGIEVGLKGLEEIKFIKEQLKVLVGDLDSFMTIDIALARGLDYYTGAIFEVKAAEGTLQSSICGGGRYDDLTGIFGLKNMSGVGISFGADRIYDVLLETGKFPADLGGSTKLLFANFGEAEALHCLKLLRQVREAGIAAELYPDAVKMAKQFKYADDKGIPYVAIIGGNEIQTGIVTIKDMKTGEQKAVKQDELIDVIIGSEA